jgi:4-alpha-glucanotransferase
MHDSARHLGAHPGPSEMRAALKQLGIERFVLGIHSSSFPPGAWDTGYGAPCSPEGMRVLDFAAALGFNAVQLGPSGRVSPANLSPYDGTVFARNPWSLGVEALTDTALGAVLEPDDHALLHVGSGAAKEVAEARAAANIARVLERCHERFLARRRSAVDDPLVRALAAFRTDNAEWLALDAVYEAIAARAGDNPALFDAGVRAVFESGPSGESRRSLLRATLGAEIERAELTQLLLHTQHQAFRQSARQRGVALWGDFQVGYSHRDRFLRADAFSADWLLGAPPSRTNPLGQPWGYPVLDPEQLTDPGSPARRLFLARARKLFAEHDGVRIDHPHGIVCPWVYAASHPDPAAAVRGGTRARESPDSTDPRLSRWAIARVSDLNPRARQRYEDDWVVALDSEQEARYAVLLDVLVDLCGELGLPKSHVAAEVLSTCPYPLQRVLQRHNLGRFRVTQKVNLADPVDAYRTDRAQPEDWLMLGTHDTAPIYPVVRGWIDDGSAALRAGYLAERLIANPQEQGRARELFARSSRALLTASLADLFISGARSVYVFIGDLFCEPLPFNRAGLVHKDNWRYRLDSAFEQVYASRLAQGRALDVVAALSLAQSRRLSALPAELI